MLVLDDDDDDEFMMGAPPTYQQSEEIGSSWGTKSAIPPLRGVRGARMVVVVVVVGRGHAQHHLG